MDRPRFMMDKHKHIDEQIDGWLDELIEQTLKRTEKNL